MPDQHILLMKLNSNGWHATQPGTVEYWLTTQLEANEGTLVSFARTLGPYDIVATIELASARTPAFAQYLADYVGGEPLIMPAYSSSAFEDAITGWTLVPIKYGEPRQGP